MKERYMKMALEEAEKCKISKDVPVGAIIIKNNKVIAKSFNQRVKRNDTTKHAEIIAISKACKKVKDWRLEGCVMYVTLEPCPMCAGAIVQSRIDKVIYGASSSKSGSCGSIMNILQNNEFNHQVEIESGVLKNECSKVLKDFFEDIRREKISENDKKKWFSKLGRRIKMNIEHR